MERDINIFFWFPGSSWYSFWPPQIRNSRITWNNCVLFVLCVLSCSVVSVCVFALSLFLFGSMQFLSACLFPCPLESSLVFCLVSSLYPGHNGKNGYSYPGLRWCHRLVFRSCESVAFREATWRGSTHFFGDGEHSGYVHRAAGNTTKPLEFTRSYQSFYLTYI